MELEPRVALVAVFVLDDISWMGAFADLIDHRDLALRCHAPLDVGMRILDGLACEGTQREIRTSSEWRGEIGHSDGAGVGLGARTAICTALGYLLDDGLLADGGLAALDVGVGLLDDLACEGTQRESHTLGE